jgi:hypothetical protein
MSHRTDSFEVFGGGIAPTRVVVAVTMQCYVSITVELLALSYIRGLWSLSIIE